MSSADPNKHIRPNDIERKHSGVKSILKKSQGGSSNQDTLKFKDNSNQARRIRIQNLEEESEFKEDISWKSSVDNKKHPNSELPLP
jgi:hypothetical protein